MLSWGADHEPEPQHVGRYDHFVYIGLGFLALAAVGALIFVKYTWNLPLTITANSSQC